MNQLRLPLPARSRSVITMGAWALMLAWKQRKYDQRDADHMRRLTNRNTQEGKRT